MDQHVAQSCNRKAQSIKKLSDRGPLVDCGVLSAMVLLGCPFGLVYEAGSLLRNSVYYWSAVRVVIEVLIYTCPGATEA